jgi:hypothetical protein
LAIIIATFDNPLRKEEEKYALFLEYVFIAILFCSSLVCGSANFFSEVNDNFSCY